MQDAHHGVLGGHTPKSCCPLLWHFSHTICLHHSLLSVWPLSSLYWIVTKSYTSPPPTSHYFRRLHSIDTDSFLSDLKSSQLITSVQLYCCSSKHNNNKALRITFNSCKTVSTPSMALATANVDKIINWRQRHPRYSYYKGAGKLDQWTVSKLPKSANTVSDRMRWPKFSSD